jgi:hypothetical protein
MPDSPQLTHTQILPMFDYPQLNFFTCKHGNGALCAGAGSSNNNNNNNAMERIIKETGTRLLGRVASGDSAKSPGVPFEPAPFPLTTLKDLRCSNQNRRFQNPEMVPIPRSIVRRAFGNYIITPNIDTSNSIFQLFNPPELEPIGPDIIGTMPIAPSQSGSLTPFRRAYNAGDPFNRFNAVPNSKVYVNKDGTFATAISPANQVQGSRRASNQAAASTAGSGRRVSENGSAYTGNPRFVYDGSDYTKYLKLKAQNNNYNDTTYGGDRHYAAQSALNRVRH